MARTLSFVVPGPPVNYQRVAVVDGRKLTPARTRSYRKHVAACAGAAALLAGYWPRGARYSMSLRVAYPDRRARDLDNAAKAICDALNGVLYADDSQIDRLLIERLDDVAEPRVEVRLEVLS